MNNLDEYNKSLEHIMTVSQDLNCLQGNIKPCVATLWVNGIERGNRDKVAYILATELRRMDVKYEDADKHLLNWNGNLNEPLKSETIRSKIKSAYRKGADGYFIKGGYKTYFCEGDLGRFCIADKETCLFRRLNFTKNAISTSGRGTGIATFATLGWLKKLNCGEIKAYNGLCEIEKRKGLKAGQLIFCSQSEIANVSGISKPTVQLALSNLFFEGLIKYKKGEQHIWKHKAGEIQRIIPIPRINQRKPHSDNSYVMTMSYEEENLTNGVKNINDG